MIFVRRKIFTLKVLSDNLNYFVFAFRILMMLALTLAYFVAFGSWLSVTDCKILQGRRYKVFLLYFLLEGFFTSVSFTAGFYPRVYFYFGVPIFSSVLILLNQNLHLYRIQDMVNLRHSDFFFTFSWFFRIFSN